MAAPSPKRARKLDFEFTPPPPAPAALAALQQHLALLSDDLQLYGVPCRALDLQEGPRNYPCHATVLARVVAREDSVVHLAAVRDRYQGRVLHVFLDRTFLAEDARKLFYRQHEVLPTMTPFWAEALDLKLSVRPQDWLDNAARVVTAMQPRLREALAPRLLPELCAVVEAYVCIGPEALRQVVAEAPVLTDSDSSSDSEA